MTRGEEIRTIILELESLKSETRDADKLYAIDANIAFYKATKSVFKYIWWLITVAPKLDGAKLLEINDLLPKYDERMHLTLIGVEKKRFPGLINAISDKVFEYITKNKGARVIGSVGSGGMELERQVISKLILLNYSGDITFIAFDQSDDAHKIAKKNLEELGEQVSIMTIDNLSQEDSNKVVLKKGIKVILARNNVFDLKNKFSQQYFDLVYSSLFTHHLDDRQYDTLTMDLKSVSKYVIEYDGYRSFFQLIPQSVVGWHDTILLNGSVMSGLRYRQKKFLPRNDSDIKINFFQIGTYLVEYSE